MRRRLGMATGLLAAALLALAIAGCQRNKSYRAERFDVDMLLYDDGSATITETVTFAFRGGPFTYAFRAIPNRETDGISGLAVYEDGRAYSVGREPGQYQVQPQGGELRVTWHFPRTENQARTFVLSYHVAGLIRQEGAQDALRWTAVPSQHDYGISQSQVVLRLPARVGPPDGARVLDGHAQPGILGRQVSFLASEIEPNQPLAVGVWFPHGQFQGVPPAWQARAQAQAARARLWLALAALILAIGLAGALWAWRRYGREPVATVRGPLVAPPGDLAAGLSGGLLHNGAILADAVATLFDLSRRGVLAVQEIEGRALGGPGFAFRLLAAPAELRPFEEYTLQMAFLDAIAGGRRLGRRERQALLQPDRNSLEGLLAEGRTVELGQAARSLQANWRRLARLYDGELYERGLFVANRDRIRGRLIAAGLAVMALGVLTVAVPAVWEALFGPWPLLVTAALLLAGLALLLAGVLTARRSVAGEQAAEEWKAFRRHLRQMARGRPQPDQAALFEGYLPYALAFGLGRGWAHQMKALGLAAPTWFRALQAEAAAQSAAFIAMMAAASAGAQSSGGAAAGGAAGGGASGAG